LSFEEPSRPQGGIAVVVGGFSVILVGAVLGDGIIIAYARILSRCCLPH
jgi:hypothetical protein